ncbi:flavodoxin [Paraflavitalea pollutisoli]|uniref:flavodoxin n=1 Tax=Paraflavitalea pollutisoli TaxID=3034143 RepID=UPI0023EC0AD5|nr:flavodoxin [Paraflavitalea sp. H1-2-19X]
MTNTIKPGLLLLVFICMLSGCSNGQSSANKLPKKTLIVYLSRTGNTKAIAAIIQKQVGGHLVALETQQPYPANYQATVQQVAHENETGFLPPLKTTIDSLQTYEVVFLGFPTWGMKLPPPMKSFLHQYDLNGKTVIPFNTNGGYGVGSSFETIKQLCPGSTVLDGFSLEGGSERDDKLLVIRNEKGVAAEKAVTGWLKKIRLVQ